MKKPLPTAEYLNLDDDRLLAQCKEYHFRASGPGGQKRNKTSTAVRLHHRPTGVTAQAVENRSQHVNKKRALGRLRMSLATESLEDVVLEQYRVSDDLTASLASQAAGLSLKDPRTLIAINEALTVLNSCTGRVSAAAEMIGVNTAALIKFLQIDRRVWRKANHIRKHHRLRPLKSTH